LLDLHINQLLADWYYGLLLQTTQEGPMAYAYTHSDASSWCKVCQNVS